MQVLGLKESNSCDLDGLRGSNTKDYGDGPLQTRDNRCRRGLHEATIRRQSLPAILIVLEERGRGSYFVRMTGNYRYFCQVACARDARAMIRQRALMFGVFCRTQPSCAYNIFFCRSAATNCTCYDSRLSPPVGRHVRGVGRSAGHLIVRPRTLPP